MDLLEYQGKQLFARHDIPVPAGRPAASVDEAVTAADAIGYPCVVKAQVQIGGRGKLGGIKVANARDEARQHADAILGMDIRGLRVHEVWIEEASQIEAEYYASIVFDRSAKAPLVMLSTKGGMDIEQVAEEDPGEIAALRNPSAEDPQEQMAKERGLTYVKLDGDIGILGNGAGLVMSTLDVVALAGGRPANFLDAGGGSKADEVVTALEVLLSNPNVTAVLFNIFGGITRCDEVARGLIEAFEQIEPDVPFVVRLDGTNDKEGRELLARADLPNVHTESTMLGAAKRVVELAGGAS